jgi:hypothetical protein
MVQRVQPVQPVQQDLLVWMVTDIIQKHQLKCL